MNKQQLHNVSKGVLLLLTLLMSWSAMAQPAATAPKVYHIQNYFSEAYLVKGNNDKLILVETGVSVEGYQDSLIASIQKLGLKPENITLAIVTHGHFDHAGNARFLQQKYHIAIAGSKYDMGKFTSGKTELAKCEDISIWGERYRPYLDMSYAPFTPDVMVDNAPIDLTKYGVNGKIIPIKGGHTPGDLLVLIDEHLFVGDAFLGTFKARGGALIPDGHHVREHFWHENRSLADENLKQIAKIASDNKVTTLYPTHNGPVATWELTKYINEEPLLKLLSQQETDRWKEATKGNAAPQKQLLSDAFVFQAADNSQLTKAEFIAAYVTQPKTKMESITTEDFRVVSSSDQTVVMTYLLLFKPQGKDVNTFLVTNTYAKEKGVWKLLFTQSQPQ